MSIYATPVGVIAGIYLGYALLFAPLCLCLCRHAPDGYAFRSQATAEALLVEGKTIKEIAQALFLSPATVRDYVSQILHKLDVSNRTEAATLALQKDILTR